MRVVCVLALLFLSLVPHTAAQPRVKLSPETVAAFDSYVEDSELVLKKRLDGELSFLWMDEDPKLRPKVRDVITHLTCLKPRILDIVLYSSYQILFFFLEQIGIFYSIHQHRVFQKLKILNRASC